MLAFWGKMQVQQIKINETYLFTEVSTRNYDNTSSLTTTANTGMVFSYEICNKVVEATHTTHTVHAPVALELLFLK